MKNIYRIFIREYLTEFKFKYIMTFILIVTQGVVTMFIPLISSVLIDKILPQKNKEQFITLVLIMISFYIINQLLSIYKDYLLVKISEGLAFKLRDKMNCKISRLSNEFFYTSSLSDILSKYDKEISFIKNNIAYMFIEMLGNIVKISIILGFMIYIDINITIVSLVGILFYFINYKFWSNRVKLIAEKNMELNSNSIEKVTENYNNVKLTKLYNAYKYATNSFRSTYKNYYKNSIKLELEYSLNINISAIILFISLGLLWLVGGYKVIQGEITIGLMTAMISYQSMLLSPMRGFSEFNNRFQETLVSLERVYSILDYDENVLGNENINEDINIIRFKNVEFSYNSNKRILRNINVDIKSNEITAIVGLSGSGKSTIVELITGFCTPNSGNIYINDKDINKLDIDSLRENISLVTQDSLFFKGTILENLNISRLNDHDNIMNLSKKLDLYDEIYNLPLGLNTVLASGGNNLSGGQKKRIDILRALLKESSIVIFDESTASLDEIRRERVLDLMNEIKKDKIVIFISHNLNELINADTIYIFEDGKLKNINDIETNNKYVSIIKQELAYV